MTQDWKRNEEKTEDDELVVTEHRDGAEPFVTPEEEQGIETVEETPREALEELGEDVASSPARRGHENVIEGE